MLARTTARKVSGRCIWGGVSGRGGRVIARAIAGGIRGILLDDSAKLSHESQSRPYKRFLGKQRDIFSLGIIFLAAQTCARAPLDALHPKYSGRVRGSMSFILLVCSHCYSYISDHLYSLLKN